MFSITPSTYVHASPTYHTGTYRTTTALKLEDPHMLEAKYARAVPTKERTNDGVEFCGGLIGQF